jgi:hypothetical protein
MSFDEMLEKQFQKHIVQQTPLKPEQTRRGIERLNNPVKPGEVSEKCMSRVLGDGNEGK